MTTHPVHAAARRLRGHLVATPLIGDVRLPEEGFAVSPHVRVKVECLQTAGSVWYRGYEHFVLRSLGRFKGLVLDGAPRAILAQAIAGAAARLPMLAVGVPLPEDIASMVAATGCEWLVDAGGDSTERRRAEALARGFTVVPGLEDPAVFEGVATLGLELAVELPGDVERVIVAPEDLVAPITAGLVAERGPAAATWVEGVPASAPRPPPGFGAAVRSGLRVCAGDAGLAALWAGRVSDRPTCVVLAV